MAESARPVSELFPPGSAAASGADSTSDGGIFPLSKSSTDVVTGPLRQKEPRKSLSSAACSRTSVDSGGPSLPPSGSDSQEHSSGPGTPETVIHRDAERPCSIAEIPWTEPPPAGEVAVNSHPCAAPGPQSHASSSSHTDLRDQRLELVQQPVQRSLSASLHTAREGPAPRRSETSVACPRAGYCGQDTAGCPGLVCKQPMQLQQSNTVTTCRGSSSSSPTQQQQQQQGGVRICLPSPSSSSGEGEAKQPSCGGEACYGHLVNHGGLEDTFAAYCHPLPIPTPAQLLPRLVGAEGECGGQRAPAHAGLLTFPRLISSVSETGLDAKRMMRCCNVDCQEQGAAYPILPPPGGLQGAGRATREAGTMTSRGELRDVGVQTELSETPPPHVYPEVSVAAEEGDAGTGTGAGGQKSPVKEVMWDAEGMTWEVYGASVDPEELGLAIQKHLELQIKEKAARAAKLSRQDTPTSQRSGRRRKRGGVMGSLRNPSCCARSSAVVD
ncbi:G protein-regulated inducer of neurite outgrowth 1 [Megalops cyprinoides]|uniref:G protein-regulated inducer of neurite outgrowth 1 n=1 Tax=Megalops cyprinoides TaxID=118141 RepID=UPI00186472F7|nr:G protein-regulated inducer of neurite outgrowth 1 [Megalops cyprinoides]